MLGSHSRSLKFFHFILGSNGHTPSFLVDAHMSAQRLWDLPSWLKRRSSNRLTNTLDARAVRNAPWEGCMQRSPCTLCTCCQCYRCSRVASEPATCCLGVAAWTPCAMLHALVAEGDGMEAQLQRSCPGGQVQQCNCRTGRIAKRFPTLFACCTSRFLCSCYKRERHL